MSGLRRLSTPLKSLSLSADTSAMTTTEKHLKHDQRHYERQLILAELRKLDQRLLALPALPQVPRTLQNVLDARD